MCSTSTSSVGAEAVDVKYAFTRDGINNAAQMDLVKVVGNQRKIVDKV